MATLTRPIPVRRLAIAAVATAMVGGSAYLAFGAGRAEGGDAPQIVFNEQRPQGTPAVLTDEQCKLADGMLRASFPAMDQQLQKSGDAEARSQLDGEYQKSLSWIASGCPADPVLGFYPDSSGTGGTWRLMEHQLFGTSSEMAWDEP